ncbi:ABC transporter [Candidatus Epulonipiscium fishelsonii]|nr:ABC transporter [Epulopiscium sp. SCG-C06WGA-EpuloA1]
MSETKKIKLVSGNLKTELFLLGVLALLFIVFGLSSEVFFKFNSIMMLLRQASIYGIIAIGMVFVITSSGIDLSVGSVVGLSGVITAMCLTAGMPIFIAGIFAIAASMVVGLLNGALIHNGKVPPFIATMGTMTVIRAFIMLITGAKTIAGLPPEFKSIAQMTVFGVPVLFLVWFAVIIVSYIIMTKTVFGRNVFAYGSNKEAARLSGINVKKTIYGVYVFSATCCAIAGFLLTARLGNAAPTAADGYELDAIAASVVGGASLDGGEGSVIGTVLGAMIMATLRQGGTLLGINSFILEIIIGSLIVIAVLLDKNSKK